MQKGVCFWPTVGTRNKVLGLNLYLFEGEGLSGEVVGGAMYDPHRAAT